MRLGAATATKNAPGRARSPRRESTRPGSGSSNSRSGPSSDRIARSDKLPPPSPRQWRKVLAAHEDGRISAVEAEVLVGYLWLGHHGVIGERTDRRRRARFADLGIPVCEGTDLLAWQLAQRIRSGELTYLDAERQLGRAALEEARQRL
jgi:hypothetical protein